MCGIAGRVNVADPVDRAQLEGMGRAIAHRGPDGEGLLLDGRVGLAHRRLAIVDKAGGAQPVAGEGGRVVLIYNGEVYNHLDLARELEPRGHRFASRCDTEAVLHAHEEWGVDAPAHLRGMFAYAAWDRATATLTLARDRLGIKPLYYAHLPSGDLLFASDVRALLLEPAVDRRLDDEALAVYLALRYVPAPATILRGVRKLEPGATLVWRGGRIVCRRFWEVPTGRAADAPAPPPTLAEAGGRLCELLDEVVELRRMGEVEKGALLSGGLDSTLVAALLCARARDDGEPPPRTFTIGYGDAGTAASDELAWAGRAAAALGSRHRVLTITGAEVAAAASRIAGDLDEPLGDPAATPLWFLARRARQEVSVVLSGEGADEVFGGYAVHARRLAAGRTQGWPGVPEAAALGLRVLGPGRLRRALELISAPDAYRGVSRAFADDESPVAGGAAAVARALEAARRHASQAATPLGRILAFDQQPWLADDLLLKADKATMAHALELRVPLLDHRLVDEVAGWPDDWKIRGGLGKVILRRAAAGLVPREILERPKMGFATPAAAWLRGALRPMARELLLATGGVAAERGAVGTVSRLLDEHERGGDRTPELWTLLALELWRAEVL